jgi:hypothetical protein
MNRNPRARQRRYGIAAVLAAALLGGGLVLLVSTRGSSSSNEPTPAADPQQAALAYAQCMRDNGVPDFPDPDANGRFSSLGHNWQTQPKFQAAAQACRAQAPGGSHESQIGTPAFTEQLVKFAQCMRANGLPDFPDPGGGGFVAAVQKLQADPKFPAAFAACQDKLPNMAGHSGP